MLEEQYSELGITANLEFNKAKKLQAITNDCDSRYIYIRNNTSRLLSNKSKKMGWISEKFWDTTVVYNKQIIFDLQAELSPEF